MMLNDLFSSCMNKLEKFLTEEDNEELTTRIQSARITANRLQAMKRSHELAVQYDLQMEREAEERSAPV